MKNKPVYESPKVSRLDDKDSLLGGENGLRPEKCSSGSGDVDGCFTTGNNAGGACLENGNSAGDFCNTGSNGADVAQG